jgi:hypothetical protein
MPASWSKGADKPARTEATFSVGSRIAGIMLGGRPMASNPERLPTLSVQAVSRASETGSLACRPVRQKFR